MSEKSEVSTPTVENLSKESVSILFAGDSGDGMQLTGNQFAATSAEFGHDLNTFPNFPSEIRAPVGTIAGVSGFQMQFGSTSIYTPGDLFDVLVAMNAAALKSKLHILKRGGMIIANADSFDEKNLRLAGYPEGVNPLEDGSLSNYELIKVDVIRLTRAALADSGMPQKTIDRSKNMFVLGLLYWLYNLPIETTIRELKVKFKNKAGVAEANEKVIKAGYYYGETCQMFNGRYTIKPAKMKTGVYRHITGNAASAMGLTAAATKAGLQLFLGSYPITPASEILQELAKQKHFGVKTFQAEDEIGAVCSCVGAAYGGALAATNTSGPGLSLKSEGLGLAVILEIPMVIINVQRGGPSTGLPTKPEQSDLFISMFGRHGDAPVPVIAARSATDCFDTAYESARIAIETMSPVICLTDGYLALSSEPWLIPNPDNLAEIKVEFAKPRKPGDEPFMPYQRDENLARPWSIPGTAGIQHRIGGLEKDNLTGNVSHDPANHELMTKLRAEKVEKLAERLPLQTIDNGPEKGKLLVLGWGSTYGAIKLAVAEALAEGYDVAHAHLRYLNPFPRNLGEILHNYEQVLIPENNYGQLVHLIRDKYLLPAKQLNKVQGLPFKAAEIKEKIVELLKAEA
ncbi:pyruvate flavodoxin/ferredoxin oxidoreductase domain protein [Chloroherpeton thalassium ATCC 35110]|uniref:Pyruvate flavodoxin/ferredoxin oxidoreductase domain protein n=1 Tax=Chloroherpeton thalassium (strain ATCC 35110 / GB-78) TaxID=517418 RepID=B3QS06_CHLT3|nr:2-oxoacid:acceptor oxidoreductase subunit alpha [Chloroherpeton thalassium]ACF13951.1 pyruvate flavodoxin/ferredoxin oxidoreductase domain protein [Chloroherpeton thalassium ATCC 35110]